MVVMVHSRFVLQGNDSYKAVADIVFFPMAMGVDLFFLISGFLMVLTTSNFDGTSVYKKIFLIKRISRIWPAYAIISVLAVLLEHKGINGFYQHDVLLSFLEGLLFIPHDPVSSPLYFMMLVNVAWTLCFEFYFYMIFAGSMFFGRYRYWAMAAWFAATLIIVPMLRSGFTMSLLSPDPIHWLRYANIVICPIVWDFIFGMIAAWIYKSKLKINNSSIIYACMAVIIGFMIVRWNEIGFINFHGPAGWGAVLAVIFIGMVFLSKNGDIRVPAWTVWLGGISYSLYLTHLYVFGFVVNTAANLHIQPENSTAYYLIARPVASIVIAYVTYKIIEEPTSKWFQHLLTKLSIPSERVPSSTPPTSD